MTAVFTGDAMISFRLNAEEVALIQRFRLLTSDHRATLTSMVNRLTQDAPKPLQAVPVIPLRKTS